MARSGGLRAVPEFYQLLVSKALLSGMLKSIPAWRERFVLACFVSEIRLGCAI
jgi:hypothetical protein